MFKDRSQLDKMQTHTVPIDTWILEHIRFNLNNWGQSVPLGSKPTHIYSEHRYDRIEYFRDPGCDDNSVFNISFFDDHCVLRASLEHPIDDEAAGCTLEYARPDFFDMVDAWIWNVRKIDYAMADMRAAMKNLEAATHGLLIDKEKAVNRLGFLNNLIVDTGRIDEACRQLASKLGDKDHLHYPKADGSDVPPYKEPYDDDVPF